MTNEQATVSLASFETPDPWNVEGADLAGIRALQEEIRRLARERNAVILAHNYQLPAVQEVADELGDSLALAIKATKTEAERIVFCGVHFMAESAKILNPEKKVLLPNLAAGCSLADSISVPLATSTHVNKMRLKLGKLLLLIAIRKRWPARKTWHAGQSVMGKTVTSPCSSSSVDSRLWR